VKPVSKLLALTLMAGSMVTAAYAQNGKPDDKVVQQITELTKRWEQAEEAKNVPFLQKLIADECVIGNSQGQILNKHQFLAKMADPARILKIKNVHDVALKQYGPVVILTESVLIDGRDHGEPFGGDFRFVRIFSMQDGRWQVVLNQGTPIQPAH
jgi:ketosteroid isomerase-like protein